MVRWPRGFRLDSLVWPWFEFQPNFFNFHYLLKPFLGSFDPCFQKTPDDFIRKKGVFVHHIRDGTDVHLKWRDHCFLLWGLHGSILFMSFIVLKRYRLKTVTSSNMGHAVYSKNEKSLHSKNVKLRYIHCTSIVVYNYIF